MSSMNVVRSVKVTLELDEDEAHGLYDLLNYGLSYSAGERLNLLNLVKEMAKNKEFSDRRNPYFKLRAEL